MSDQTESHRVLVVDDEPNIVDVVAMALRFQGFAVETAGTGAAALSAVSAFRPHLMVLDVMLPDMEGFDVAQRLGAQRARVPIIFLTARDDTADKIRGLSIGGDDYVTKPFSLEELVAASARSCVAPASPRPTRGASSSRTSSSTRRRARSAAPASSWTSPRPSTGCCATSCSTHAAS